jgi:hypothetical protein
MPSLLALKDNPAGSMARWNCTDLREESGGFRSWEWLLMKASASSIRHQRRFLLRGRNGAQRRAAPKSR